MVRRARIHTALLFACVALFLTVLILDATDYMKLVVDVPRSRQTLKSESFAIVLTASVLSDIIGK